MSTTLSENHAIPALSACCRSAVLDKESLPVRQLHRLHALTGLPLSLVDASTGCVLASTAPQSLSILPAGLQEQLLTLEGATVKEWPSGLVTYALQLPRESDSALAVAGYALAKPNVRPAEIALVAAEQNWNPETLDSVFRDTPQAQPRVIERLLSTALAQLESEAERALQLEEIEQLGDQIGTTYEEISLLHTLTQNLQISRSPDELAQLCLHRLRGLVCAGGNVIWIHTGRGDGHFLVDGELPFNESQLEQLIAHFDKHDWSRPLVKNYVDRTLLGASYPGLRNFVIVSIAEGMHRSGWIVSCNLDNDQEFGTIEASLLSSIATILGTHLRNIDLYRQHEELMLSFVRSLVSTLDAKDPYTRGHSERVALIARRIGEELGLPEEDLQDIYLSGLLHDIGKIGVDDRILQKPGKLTPEEFAKIQRHPMIGYAILAGLKNLHSIIPGVRSHHESFNGTGYPDGLRGEDIPFMARILAVADSYDAMGSSRPYRDGMPVDQIETIFRRGAGRQWDSRVIDAYFRCRESVQRICEEYSPSDGNLLLSDSWAE